MPASMCSLYDQIVFRTKLMTEFDVTQIVISRYEFVCLPSLSF